MARAAFASYVVLAVFLGIVYSWSWAAAVIVMGFIPALLIWLVDSNVDNARDYYDWSDRESRNR